MEGGNEDGLVSVYDCVCWQLVWQCVQQHAGPSSAVFGVDLARK